MTTELIAELKIAAGKVDKAIAESTFPDAVSPVYLADAMRRYPANGGKRLRPAIMLWSAAAAGGDMDKILPAAAALEIFHNWTLVHDDIIDDDDLRRGNPTAHIVLSQALELPEQRRRKFGSDMAILAGDLMQGWAFELLDQTCCTAEVRLKLASELRCYGYLKLVSGEAEDVEMSCCDPAGITVEAVRNMLLGKTGALLHFAARGGWLAGKDSVDQWDSVHARALGEFGDSLALAFQLQDDYLGIFGDVEKFGKPIGSDLQEGKATLLLLHALKNLPAAAAEELRGLLYCHEYTSCDIARARELFSAAGSVKYLQREICRLTDESCKALNTLPDSKYKTLLLELANYLITREK